MSDNWVMGKTREEDNAVEFEMPPIGLYKFELVGKDEDKAQKPEYDSTGEKKRARFHFKIVDDEDWEGFVAKCWYNISLNDQSFWLPVVEALLGRTLGPSERVGMDDDPVNGVTGIKGLQMMGTLKHDTKADGKVFPRIESPFPVKKSKSSRVRATETTENTEPAPF